jgi:hypothetical protein
MSTPTPFSLRIFVADGDPDGLRLAELFQKDVRTINEHLQNFFAEGELSPDSVIRNFRITAADGKNYDTAHYNLDVIISVGYRVGFSRFRRRRRRPAGRRNCRTGGDEAGSGYQRCRHYRNGGSKTELGKNQSCEKRQAEVAC